MAEDTNTFGLWYFTLQGIGALLGWNAVLSSLDYFDNKFPNFDVNFIFPIAIFVANMILSPNMIYVQQKLSLNIRIAGALAMLGVVMILLPLEAYIFSDTDFGVALILGLLFCLGLANTSQQVSASGFAGIFPFVYVNKYILGTGLAGLIISALRIMILLALGDNANTDTGQIIGILLYYGIAAVFLGITIVVHYRFVKTDFCKKTIADNEKKTLLASQQRAINKTESSAESLESTPLVAEKSNPWMKLYEGFSLIKLVFMLIVVIYIQTFMMFPGVMLLKEMSFLNDTWKTVLLAATFNVFDVVGKSLTNYRQYYNSASTTVLVFGRFVFFMPFILMALNMDIPIIGTDYFPFVNIALFALTNGYATSSCFILGPEYVADDKKETAGFITMFGLLFGIFTGSFLALAFTNL